MSLIERYRLEAEISQHTAIVKRAKDKLDKLEQDCSHTWGKVTADHIYHKAYTIPGDPSGTMGSDWRGPFHVPAKIEQRWKRICSNCGKVEYTSKTETTTTQAPRFL